MMKFLSRSDEKGAEALNYESVRVVASKVLPGVRFSIRRMSFGRRLALGHRIREIAPHLEALEASTEFTERVEANVLGQEIENLYVRWGLAAVEGMSIDGEKVTAEALIERGPEALAKEIVTAIQAECGLSEVERKN